MTQHEHYDDFQPEEPDRESEAREKLEETKRRIYEALLPRHE